MTKIKILGLIIILMIGSLVYLFSYTMQEHKKSVELQKVLNKQKSYTQEISKDVFYIYKNNSQSMDNIYENIKRFSLKIPTDSMDAKKQTEVILALWDKFKSQVDDFKKLNSIVTAYSSIILQQIVKDIYHTNLDLVVEFDKLEKIHENKNIQKLKKYTYLEYFFSISLAFLLLYMFTQVQAIIEFIQKFSSTSRKIISNSSIRGLHKIESTSNSQELQEVTDNYNVLVNKIDESIKYASISIENSSDALDTVEKDIEDFLGLLDEMHEDDEIDKELTKKEDVLIHSLEELTTSALKLKNLKKDFLTLVKL